MAGKRALPQFFLSKEIGEWKKNQGKAIKGKK